MLHENRSRAVAGFLAGAALMITGAVAFNAVRADAIGDDETTFVPITACRLIDTRPAPARVGPSGTLEDETITVVAHGSNGKCTIPTTATGLSLNVTALHATEWTFLTFWDDGDRPDASSLNPQPGQPPTPNAVNVPLSDTGTFNVFNAFGTVNIIIDVTGYYTNTGLQQLAASLPITASGYAEGNPYIQLKPTGTTVVATTLTVPGDGKVTVTASAHTFVMGDEIDLVQCSITTGSTVEAGHELYLWTPDNGPMAGVRVFDVDAGQTATYRLVCSAGTSALARNADIAAIYTPAG